MEEKILLQALRSGQPEALEAIIQQFTPYVATVIRNQLGSPAPSADVEEIASTVFFTLWQKRQMLRTTHLRSWLGTVARNCTRTYLRQRKQQTVTLDDVILVSGDRAAQLLEAEERARILHTALSQLGSLDCEIFQRYYYRRESIGDIAGQCGLHPEAVKSRLRRGRQKLKEILQQEGYTL